MKQFVEVGDNVALKVAVLYGLQTTIRDALNTNPDSAYHVGTISWGRESFGEDEVRQTIISFIEPPKPADITVDSEFNTVRTYDWTVYAQGIIANSFDTPLLPAYELVAEIKTILAAQFDERTGIAKNNIFNLGPAAQRARNNKNNVFRIRLGSETVRGPGDHSRYTFFWLPIQLGLVEDIKSPRVTVQNPL